MNQDYVEIEHQVIRDGFNELFTFTEIYSDKILHWGEETSTEEEEETEQLSEGPSRSRKQNESNIIFRQVNRFH